MSTVAVSHDPRLLRLFRSVSWAASAGVVLLGATVLAARILGLESLWLVRPLLLMRFTTAVCFVLTGVALLLLQDHPVSRPKTVAARVLGVAVAVLALLALTDSGFGVELALERALTSLYPAADPPFALPSPNSMVAFLFVAPMLALLEWEWRGRRPARYLLAPLVLFAFVSVLGHLFGISPLYQVGQHGVMPPQTAAGLMLVSIAFLFARPRVGFISLLAQQGPGGLMARSMTPVGVILPPAAGWVTLQGYRLGLYDPPLGYALFAITAVVGLLLVVVYNARRLQEADEDRRTAEAETGRLNRRLTRQTADLTLANKELEAFSYSVSHDLRAPLRAIDGFSLALLEDEGERLSTQGQDYLARVRAASQRMGELIDGLLGLSRLSRLELDLSHVDLGGLAREKCRALEDAEPERRVEWHITDGVEAEGDRRMLRVVVDNLLENAWKFTRGRSPARIEFGVLPREGGLVYYVKDNGAGFDMDHASKLFGAFQRLHGVREFEGLGIGLATVQRIVHRHGGRIWAEGRPDEGAGFYFTLGWAPSIVATVAQEEGRGDAG